MNAPVHKAKHIYEIEIELSWLIQLSSINAQGSADKTIRCRKYTQQNQRGEENIRIYQEILRNIYQRQYWQYITRVFETLTGTLYRQYFFCRNGVPAHFTSDFHFL